MARRKSQRSDVNSLLNRFAEQEEQFLRREFLAPALAGGMVRVRIGQAVCRIKTEPSDFEGWGVFQPLSFNEAMLVREASLAERRRYLDLFPRVRLIVCLRRGQQWMCSSASHSDSRMRLEGVVAVALLTEVQQFDVIVTRYDGSQFWFDEIDMRGDPASAVYLRESLAHNLPASELSRSGLTAEHRAAYELNQWEAVRLAERAAQQEQEARTRRILREQRHSEPQPQTTFAESDVVRERLRQNLSHAGARLVDYLERSDSFRVTYVVDGQQYTSSVDKQDLTIQSAGICLDGTDRTFDLASLVGVLREGQQGGDIYRME